MDRFLEFAVAVARESGNFLKEHLYSLHTVGFKGEINIVTGEDRKSEDMIIKRIRREFPAHDILTEESLNADTGAEYKWIIDPLDGTTNYAHGHPVFCVSVALQRKGEVLLGCVFNPMLDELFVAEKGSGAYLNGARIRVSDVTDLGRGFLATGFPYDIRTDRNNNINYFVAMAKRSLAIRRAGSAALDLAYTAAGRFDGFWELKLSPWDTAAGAILVEEAGGLVTDISGNDFLLSSPHIIASNGKIHSDIIKSLRAVDPLESCSK